MAIIHILPGIQISKPCTTILRHKLRYKPKQKARPELTMFKRDTWSYGMTQLKRSIAIVACLFN